MTYIVNPIWFYLMSIADAVVNVSVFSAVVAGGLALVFFASASESHEEEKAMYKRRGKIATWIAAISVVLVVFVPSKETLMQIMIAKYATYENADNAIQAIKSAADYVIEAAGKLQ